jgi:hypothetical protein
MSPPDDASHVSRPATKTPTNRPTWSTPHEYQTEGGSIVCEEGLGDDDGEETKAAAGCEESVEDGKDHQGR